MGRIWIMRQICVILVCHEYGHVWVEETHNVFHFIYYLCINLFLVSYVVYLVHNFIYL